MYWELESEKPFQSSPNVHSNSPNSTPRRKRPRSKLYRSIQVVTLLLCGYVIATIRTTLHRLTTPNHNSVPSYARTLACYFPLHGAIIRTQRLPTYIHELYPTHRLIANMTSHTNSSRDYRHGQADSLENDHCQPQHHWQSLTYPTCNVLHEWELCPHSYSTVRLVANGHWRDVWKVNNVGKVVVIKTLRMEHEFTDRNIDRNRRDAVASDRLTKSVDIVDIYGYCGGSGVFDYSDGGDVEELIWGRDTPLESQEMMTVAKDIVHGVMALHDTDDNGRASIAHADITPSQFIWVNGRYKLNDFNRCRFITWDPVLNETCFFEVHHNPGKWRSPEEYAYIPLSEKIDVFSMGTTLYSLLTQLKPYDTLSSKEAQTQIIAGYRPAIPFSIRTSEDPNIVALTNSIAMCWKHNVSERASAKDVASYLDKVT